MTNRGYFVSGVFVTITLMSMASMFHTLWITDTRVQALEYSNTQLLGLLIGSLGSAVMFYLWESSGSNA